MQPQVVTADAEARPGRFAGWKVAVPAGLLAVLAGAAIMLQIRGWAALESESGRVCGTGGARCPGHEVPALVVSFLVGLAAIPLTIWAVARNPKTGAVTSGGTTPPNPPGIAVTSGRTTPPHAPGLKASAAAAGLAAGVFAGLALTGWVGGTQLRVDWTAPADGSAAPATEGVWTAGGSLIRVRTDQIVSYDSGTGRASWTLAVPGGDVACAVSAQPAGAAGAPGAPGTGLIGYGAAGGACDHVLAVDLGTGRALWSKLAAGGWKGDQGTGFVAAGGDTAVVVTPGAVTGYDLRTGAPRWTQPTPAGCSDQTVAAAPRSVVALAACGRAFAVIALDPASGRQLWRTPVPVPAPGYQFAILSADPVVVADLMPGTPPSETALAFGADGRLESTIPVGSVNLDTNDYQGSGPDIAVTGGLLIGVTRPSGGHSDVVAFRLSDGRQQWLVRMPDDVVSLRQDGGRLLVLDQAQPAPALDAITVSAGSLSAVGIVPRNVAGPGGVSVYPVGGRYLVVNSAGGSPVPPVAAVGG